MGRFQIFGSGHSARSKVEDAETKIRESSSRNDIDRKTHKERGKTCGERREGGDLFWNDAAGDGNGRQRISDRHDPEADKLTARRRASHDANKKDRPEGRKCR